MLVTLDEAKKYLRIDSDDDDALIQSLLNAGTRLSVDVSRLSEAEWAVIDSDAETDESGFFADDEMKGIRDLIKIAILYSTAYLYEHREEADHHDLVMTLRNILFSVREGRPVYADIKTL